MSRRRDNDDYLTKPFVLAEREARVRALIRRSHGRDRNDLVQDALAFDSAVRSASVDGTMPDPSAREMALLELLVMGCGRVVAKEQFVEHRCGCVREVTEALRGDAVALTQLLVLVVAILLTVYGYAYVLGPLQQLKLLIDRRGSGDLSPLDPESAPHDLRPLILSINGPMDAWPRGPNAPPNLRPGC